MNLYSRGYTAENDFHMSTLRDQSRAASNSYTNLHVGPGSNHANKGTGTTAHDESKAGQVGAAGFDSNLSADNSPFHSA